jgi:hypothetical protein
MNKDLTLIITRSSGEYISWFNQLSLDKDILWLQLWPAFDTEVILKRNPNIKVIKSTDHITNDDHFEIAKSVLDVSANWWRLLGLSEKYEEWNIEGLQISEIFSYDLEQVITTTLYNLTIIKRVILKYAPIKIIILDNIVNNANQGSIVNAIHADGIYNILKDADIGNVTREESSQPKLFMSIFKELFNNAPSTHKILDYLSRRYYYSTSEYLANNSIIISSTKRRLHQFIRAAKRSKPIFILKNSKLSADISLESKLDIIELKEISYLGVSITPIFKIAIPRIEIAFHQYDRYYRELTSLIKAKTPLMYITVNIANSIELVKMWAFKKADIRTVWSSEGLGQPDSNISNVLNSVFRYSIDIERWLVSEYFNKLFLEKSSRVTTGCFVIGPPPRKLKRQSKSEKKRVVFMLGMASHVVKRAILFEDMHEMLNSIRDISSVISEIPGIELVIKVHPGDSLNIPLYRQAVNDLKDINILDDGKIDHLIDSSGLVIVYDTSVAIEALYRKKNVICYNYTSRPSFVTSIYDYLNHDPEKGAALIMVQTKYELKISVEKLLLYANSAEPSPGLEYVLENAREGYSLNKVVTDLIKHA